MLAWHRLFPKPVGPAGPANYGTVIADHDRIDADARYAVKIARGYVSELPGGVAALQGKTILELGPGLHLGTPLILRSWGAREVAVADRFLVRFQPQYHIRLYKRIGALLKHEDRGADTEPLDKCAAAREHLPAYLTAIEVPLEGLGEVARARFDITLSNAVLEHVYDPAAAIRSLASVSRAGGVGLHQIDFRDHRDFSRPLEYLLLDEAAFHSLLTESHAECGNRIRPDELLAILDQSDFDQVQFTPNIWAEEKYLEEFLPRLRAARGSPYCDIDVARLRPISGLFKLTID
jgi:hypothetical protein